MNGRRLIWIPIGILIILLCLYFIKSKSNIDLFEDSHALDWLTGRVLFDKIARHNLWMDIESTGLDDKQPGKNLLPDQWRIVEVQGVEVTTNKVLEINFIDPSKFNYYHHVSKRCFVYSNTLYEVSGYLKTDLDHTIKIKINVEDDRGTSGFKFASTAEISGLSDWSYVKAFYRTLSDARAIKIIVYGSGNHDDKPGKVYLKNVKLERVGGH